MAQSATNGFATLFRRPFCWSGAWSEIPSLRPDTTAPCHGRPCPMTFACFSCKANRLLINGVRPSMVGSPTGPSFSMNRHVLDRRRRACRAARRVEMSAEEVSSDRLGHPEHVYKGPFFSVGHHAAIRRRSQSNAFEPSLRSGP